MNIKCFLIKPNGKASRWLRRYKTTEGSSCPLTGSYHNAQVPIEDSLNPENRSDEPAIREMYKDQWPAKCNCGYIFSEEDPKQIFSQNQYIDEAGKVYTLNSAPVGAIWDATWFHEMDEYRGPDGLSLVCKTPGGDWMMDGRASNCDSSCKTCGVPYKDHKNVGSDTVKDNSCDTYEDYKPHKCWVRHGEPPNLTVDKNGVTCGAGAGSILQKNYHGFLTNGELTNC